MPKVFYCLHSLRLACSLALRAIHPLTRKITVIILHVKGALIPSEPFGVVWSLLVRISLCPTCIFYLSSQKDEQLSKAGKDIAGVHMPDFKGVGRALAKELRQEPVETEEEREHIQRSDCQAVSNPVIKG
jgi:hypothetical protein